MSSREDRDQNRNGEPYKTFKLGASQPLSACQIWRASKTHFKLTEN